MVNPLDPIEPYVHHCYVREGLGAGNKVIREVTSFEFENQDTCEHCGEPLATVQQMVAHIYEQLLPE